MTYFSTIHADAPLHWWRLADPGGALAFDIGSSFLPLNYLIQGMVPNTGPSSDGASSSHSAQARVVTTTFAVALTNTWSIEGWYWIFNRSPGDQNLVTLVNAGGTRIALRDQASGFPMAFISGQPTAAGVVAPPLLQWNHMVATYDHVTLRLYVNGFLAAATPVVTATTGNYECLVGEDTAVTALLTGWLSEVAVYSVTLSAAQVTAHFNAADLVHTPPVYLGGGKYDVTLGVTTPLSSDLTSVLQSVRKTFPTT